MFTWYPFVFVGSIFRSPDTKSSDDETMVSVLSRNRSGWVAYTPATTSQLKKPPHSKTESKKSIDLASRIQLAIEKNETEFIYGFEGKLIYMLYRVSPLLSNALIYVKRFLFKS